MITSYFWIPNVMQDLVFRSENCKTEKIIWCLNGIESFQNFVLFFFFGNSWLPIENGTKYRGVFAGCVWTLSQDDENLHYVLHNSSTKDETTSSNILQKYFNLETSLRDNINKWSSCDPQFEKSCSNAAGVRILDQDIVENLFSFICSSNNNIPRYTNHCKFFLLPLERYFFSIKKQVNYEILSVYTEFRAWLKKCANISEKKFVK